MKFKTVWLIAALVVMLPVVGGCVGGLAPIGWSGGSVAGGKVYLGTAEGRLVAYDTVTGGLGHSEPLRSGGQAGLFGCAPSTGGGCSGGSLAVAIYSTPLIEGERIYLGAYNGRFYAYDANTLQVDDVFPAEGYLKPIVGGAVMAGDLVIFGGSDGLVYALDKNNLVLEKKFATGGKIWGSPARDGETVFIGSFDKKLYALSSVDLTLKWDFTTGGAVIAAPLVVNGTVYIGSFDRSLYALAVTDGRLKGQFTGGNWFWAEPVVSGDIVYAGNLDGYLYALRAEKLDKINEFKVGPVSARPVIWGDFLIVASRDGFIWKINTVSGELTKITELGAEVNAPLAADGEIVYIHTQDMTLHRVNVATNTVLPAISLRGRE